MPIGIRVSCWDDGKPFDLRSAERTIELGVSYAINELKNLEEVIDDINQRLLE